MSDVFMAPETDREISGYTEGASREGVASLTDMLAPLPEIEWADELYVEGSTKNIDLKSKKAADAIRNIATRMAERFTLANGVANFRIPNIGLELNPENRAEIRQWLDDNIPLGSDMFVWSVGFNGDAKSFDVLIRPRRQKKVK